MSILHASRPAVLAALGLGALSTFGDWLWTHYLEDGAWLPGVVHGVVIFAALAAVLASHAGTRRAFKVLMPSLPLAGLAIAAAFYPIAKLVGYLPALLIAWVAMWIALAVLQRLARGRVEPLGRALQRAVLAAVGSGAAFAAVSSMWTAPDPAGPNLPLHFLYWSFAFLPGFLALMIGQAPPSPAAAPEDRAAV